MISKYLISVISIMLTSMFFSCEEFVSIPGPETELSLKSVFESDETAISAMVEIYAQMSQVFSFSSGGNSAISFFEGAYADELVSLASSNTDSSFPAFYLNNVLPTNSIVSSTWSSCYNIIYKANRIMEGLESSNSISLSIERQLMGEALFMRAFCHFYLVNLFGEVPLILTSDYQFNAKVSRTAVNQVYEKIIADLLNAKELLSDNYPSSSRVRPNKGAAIAMLARSYLYAGEFAQAEAQATEIINKTSQYHLLSDLNSVFMNTSEEAIWQLIPNGGNSKHTYEGQYFILLAPPTFVTLRKDLVNVFETGDQRRRNWIDSLTSTSRLTKWHYPFKYKETFKDTIGSEYSMVLRLAEQYLIRAEARVQQDKLTGENSAVSDINMIRKRAGLRDTPAITKDQLLMAIEHERRVELFTEWGHRFFDLKRTGRLDAVLDPIKPYWDSQDALLPIPQSEILINKNLIQNPGY